MKCFKSIPRRGFTLIELLTAMAITMILVYVIAQLTTAGIDLWKVVREDVSSSARSRVALQSMSADLQSMQMRSGDNTYEWLCAESDDELKNAPRNLNVPSSARIIFFCCPPDRNPAVGNSSALLRNYRNERAMNLQTQGDVCAVSYNLRYRDEVLNLPGDGGAEGIFPLFSLYRSVLSPRDSFERVMGKDRLSQNFMSALRDEETFFLCENIVEMNLILTLQYIAAGADLAQGRAAYETLSVPIISSRGNGASKLSVYGDRIEVNGKKYENARIVSANMFICVLTEEGVAVVEQVRQGRRKAPKQADFFARYTRAFSCSVAMPTTM